jgi:hypothetical protein
MGLSGEKNPDCLRFAGDGDGGTIDRLSRVRSDKEGRGFRAAGLGAGKMLSSVTRVLPSLRLLCGDCGEVGTIV